jgi:hypothetical protein
MCMSTTELHMVCGISYRPIDFVYDQLRLVGAQRMSRIIILTLWPVVDLCMPAIVAFFLPANRFPQSSSVYLGG